MTPLLWCNGECLVWTKKYSATGVCQECGAGALSAGEGEPDLDFEVVLSQ